MTTIPDFGQAHETCGGVELALWVHNPPPTSGQRKRSMKAKAATNE